jgi:transcriptional regulator with XRE-family HTH domain
MKELYNKYNLSKNHFAELLRMDVKTLTKYEQGKKLRVKTISKIELGKKIVMGNNIIFPKREFFRDNMYYSFYREDLRKADKQFKILYEEA